MPPAEEPSLRDQLVEARTRIIAQLDELNYRVTAPFARRGGRVDYRNLVAELEGELREIDALLGGLEDAGT
ncbi:hypothetical protein [Sphingomonas sp.]|jgi:hypothetical protein|uniref:hypothetical protein n=1 Tax=Sphingomonas sp. TaxID=28214 RepID=UPI002E35273F|nr:hypothetical protein [Sphingomonas sp.]HEX4695704.1 hypothetical protein [Sphingomonas sp.]